MFVGANAGMFHAFDANPNVDQGGGRELFAYVPRSTYPYLSELTNPEYRHRYFVDGPVVEGDVYLNGAWKTVVMGSSGAGPAGLFALDVTAPETFDPSNVLWDITPAEEPDLGKVMGHGYIGSVKYQNGGKWVALVPNGYQSTNNHAVLLVIDMADRADAEEDRHLQEEQRGAVRATSRAAAAMPTHSTDWRMSRDLRREPQRRRGLLGRLPGQPVEVRPEQRHCGQLAHRYRRSERQFGKYPVAVVHSF